MKSRKDKLPPVGGILAIVPSRLASTRLPEKPLKVIEGKSLVNRVWDVVTRSALIDYAAIATDDQQIFDHVQSFGGRVIMTSSALSTGSERVYAAASLIAQEFERTLESFEMVLNVQGDMPLLPPEVIDRLITFLRKNKPRFSMATIAAPLSDEERYLSPNVVKVVVSESQEGLYFSRAPIPLPREVTERCSVVSPYTGERVYGFRHLGLYAFTPAGLSSYSDDRCSGLEKIERLEQLRVLERGNRIGVEIIEDALLRDSVEVDTPEDLAKAAEIFRRRG